MNSPSIGVVLSCTNFDQTVEQVQPTEKVQILYNNVLSHFGLPVPTSGHFLQHGVRLLLDGWEPVNEELAARAFSTFCADATGQIHVSAELLQKSSSLQQTWLNGRDKLTATCTEWALRSTTIGGSPTVPFYRLRFSLTANGSEDVEHWVVWHRFSDFEALNKRMKATLQGGKSMPQMPKKTWGKTSPVKPVFLQERAAKLADFVTALLALPNCRQSAALRSFIGVYAHGRLSSPRRSAASPESDGLDTAFNEMSIFRTIDPAVGDDADDEVHRWLAALTPGHSLRCFRSELAKLGVNSLQALLEGELVFESDAIAMGMTANQRALLFAATDFGEHAADPVKAVAQDPEGFKGLEKLVIACFAEEREAEAARMSAATTGPSKAQTQAPALRIQYCGG